MLQPDAAGEQGVPRAGHVTGGEHAGRARGQVLVGDHPVVQVQPGRLGELDPRGDAHARQHHVGRQSGPVGQPDLLHPVAAPQRLDSGAEVQLHALIGVHVAVERAELGSEHPFQGQPAQLDHGHVRAQLAGRGGHLAADPPRADHDHPVSPGDRGPQPLRIGHGPQVMHAGEVGPRDRQAPGPGPGGEQDGVVAEPLARREHDLAPGWLQPAHRRGQAQVNVVLVVVGRVVHERHVGLRLALEVLLRQRRPLVGPHRFLADERDPPVEALFPQGLSRLGSGQAGPDDDESAVVGHDDLLSMATVSSCWSRALACVSRRRRPGPGIRTGCARRGAPCRAGPR